MKQKKVIIAGGTGFIGSHVSEALKKAGYSVHLLSRPANEKSNSILWDGENLGSWCQEIEDSFAVINFSGAPIFRLWSEDYKKKILDSRVNSTKVLGQAIEASNNPPEVWVNASAAGFYGDTQAREVTEENEPGQNFLSDVCVQWEQAALKANTPQTRKIFLRTTVVLGKDAPAFILLKKITQCFLGGAIGNGQQYVSWIHINDFISALEWTLNQDMEGPINLSSPKPLTNSEFMKIMRKCLHRPWSPPVPTCIVKLVGKLINTEAELQLISQRIIPKRLLNSGYQFSCPNLDNAVKSLINIK